MSPSITRNGATLAVIACFGLLAACSGGPSQHARPATSAPPAPARPPPPPAIDTGAAMIQLLEISAQRSIARLSQRGALWNDPQLRIPLPPMMQRASRYLTLKGYSQELVALQASLNYCAELALADFAQPLSLSTQQLQWPSKGTVSGGDRAATAFFYNQRHQALQQALVPLVSLALHQTTVGAEYEALIQGAGPLGAFLAGPRDDLRGFVAQHAINALFRAMAEQESRLRHDPEGGGIDLLRRWYRQNQQRDTPVTASATTAGGS